MSIDKPFPRRRSGHNVPDNVERMFPNSPEAEAGVLGCIMLSPADCMAECMEKVRVEDFFDLRHQAIYQIFLDLTEEGVGIDIITIVHRLKDGNRLEGIGGLPYLTGLPDSVPSPYQLPEYLEIMGDKAMRRQLIQGCTSIAEKVYENEPLESLLESVERDISRAVESRNGEAPQDIKELVHQAINTVDEYHQRQGKLTGIATGFLDFDKLTGGLQNGDMIVIAARPSVGKTALAMNIAERVAIDDKIPVGVFSLEMTAASLTLRLLCSRARVNMRNVRDGFMAGRDFATMTGAAGMIAKAPLHIDASSGLSIGQLRAKARRMVRQHGIKLFIVDYLQLLSAARRGDNRQQEISDISNGLKGLAKELNVPIVVLSQLNRDMEKEKKSRKPRLSDIRESGSIEQDADVVGLLYRPKVDDDDDEKTEAIPVNMVIAKQRNGPTGEVHLTFIKSYTRFESASKVSEDDQTPNKPYAD